MAYKAHFLRAFVPEEFAHAGRIPVTRPMTQRSPRTTAVIISANCRTSNIVSTMFRSRQFSNSQRSRYEHTHCDRADNSRCDNQQHDHVGNPLAGRRCYRCSACRAHQGSPGMIPLNEPMPCVSNPESRPCLPKLASEFASWTLHFGTVFNSHDVASVNSVRIYRSFNVSSVQDSGSSDYQRLGNILSESIDSVLAHTRMRKVQDS